MLDLHEFLHTFYCYYNHNFHHIDNFKNIKDIQSITDSFIHLAMIHSNILDIIYSCTSHILSLCTVCNTQMNLYSSQSYSYHFQTVRIIMPCQQNPEMIALNITIRCNYLHISIFHPNILRSHCILSDISSLYTSPEMIMDTLKCHQNLEPSLIDSDKDKMRMNCQLLWLGFCLWENTLFHSI